MRWENCFWAITLSMCLIVGCGGCGAKAKSGSSKSGQQPNPAVSPPAEKSSAPDPLTPQGQGNVRRTERD